MSKSSLSNWLKLLIFILSSIRFLCIFLFSPHLFTILFLVPFSLVHYNVRVSSSDLIYFWILYYCPLSPFTNGAEQMCFVIILLSCDDPNGVQVPLPHPGDRRPLTGRTQQDRRGQSLSSSQHCPCQKNQSLACQWTLFFDLTYLLPRIGYCQKFKA